MKIYCSGIGGIGLSAYAALQANRGHQVSGSDRKDSALLQDLRGQGIEVFLSQDGSHVPADADLFVYTEAVPPDAPERKKAAEYGLTCWSYFHALGELSKASRVVAVCGTHGKSSTTSMVARMLIACGKDPSVIVGTKVQELDGRNWRAGKTDLFALEACEYRRSFHYLHPDIVLMTNVDGDHFDAYKDVPEYQEAFSVFLSRLPADGVVITHLQDPDCKKVAEGSGKKVIDADAYPLIALETPGEHMRQNARLALALADVLGIPQADAQAALKGFAGTWRRMEVKGTWNGVTVVDDYAHHPKEIRATLGAMRERHPDARIVVVFQPHTHDRTIKLYDEFTPAFEDADVVVVPNVYNARSDIETAMADVPQLVSDISKISGVETHGVGSLDGAERWLREGGVKAGDVLVCMGAGDITELAAKLVR